MNKKIIDENKLFRLIDGCKNPEQGKVKSVFRKALELKGLDSEDVATLININDDVLLEELFITAQEIKENIYGKRLVLFAPLYISNHCSNDCQYCGFRVNNKNIERTQLTMEQIKDETLAILEQGHKRILMLMGETHDKNNLDYLLDAIESVYSVKDSKGSSIRRINLEIAPLSEDEFRKISNLKIGTYTVFQESYHKETYKTVHSSGRKQDYYWRLETMDRALSNGMNDVGIGVLYGLYDYRFETLALVEHSKYLDKTFGVGPHTISVPRVKPADNAPASINSKYFVSDSDFKKLIALLRCAVPYTGIILSTRESASLRSELFSFGVSQISAGSVVHPGGYKQAMNAGNSGGQFSLNDTRKSGEVIKDVICQGYIPSFCTACYRLGRVGADFMDLAKPGLIKTHCHPNAIMTLKEYLIDYADTDTQILGNTLIEKELENIQNQRLLVSTRRNLKKIEEGIRDLYF